MPQDLLIIIDLGLLHFPADFLVMATILYQNSLSLYLSDYLDTLYIWCKCNGKYSPGSSLIFFFSKWKPPFEIRVLY